MSFFRSRHGLKKEYSGVGEASNSLRMRLATVCNANITTSTFIGTGHESSWVRKNSLSYELTLNLEEDNIYNVIHNGSYDCVFEAVEIFLKVASEQARSRYRSKILPDFQRAFILSGSVYYVDNDGLVKLRVKKELASKLEKAKKALSKSESTYDVFFEAVTSLFDRSDKPKNIVKDIFVAFENYLKEVTKTKSFKGALKKLEKENVIVSVQKSLIEKIKGYRSDAFAVAHPGKSGEPGEIEALWFLEIVTAQINYINSKLDIIED